MRNESFTYGGGWNSLNLFQNNVILIMCVIATVLHFQIWFQLFIHKTKFDLSFLFSLAYISTDIFLISSFFIQYSIRIRSWIPVIPLSCYFEGYSMFYFNLLEPYCLAALNICRYWQIARNQNIYKFHRRKLILISIIIPLLILTNLIIQDIFGWCIVIEKSGASCSLAYTNIIVQIWNLIIVLTIPILISFYMLFRAVYYLQNTNAQQMIIRRNHHHRLIIDSFIFYFMWLCLWLPVMIITFLGVGGINESITFVALVANTFETLIDPLMAIFLDKRFAKASKKSCIWIKRKIDHLMNVRVYPVV